MPTIDLRTLTTKGVTIYQYPYSRKFPVMRKPVPWYKDPSKLSEAQWKSITTFAAWALENLVGQTGVGTLPDGRLAPRPAVIVAEKYPKKGVGVFGGKDPRIRRIERSIARLQKLYEIAKKVAPAQAEKISTLIEKQKERIKR